MLLDLPVEALKNMHPGFDQLLEGGETSRVWIWDKAINHLLPREVSKCPSLFWEQGYFVPICAVTLLGEFSCFTTSSFSVNLREFSNVYYLKESQHAASHCESQSVPVTWAQSIIGDWICRERQKEPGALYK